MPGDTDRIKERLSILDIVGEYVKLTRAGSSYKGLSPFTTEKTPSFFVSPDKGLYHCFSTGKGGDMFTFIQEMEGVDFPSALEILARKAGITLTGSERNKKEEDEISSCLEAASLFFQEEAGKNKEVQAYITQRGISDETRDSFKIGFAPDTFDALKKRLSSFSEEHLIKAGLLRKREGGHTYDYFRNRIMFPLFARNGKIVGFSGRALGDEVPKYLNSPDSPLYNKSSLLYGLERAKQGIRSLNCAILVEGQIDLVLAHQVGFTNTVATSGTALTSTHLSILKNLTDNLIFAFDSDKAGLSSALRAGTLALPLEFSVKMALLPDDTDPADLIQKDKELFKTAIRDADHVGVVLARAIGERSPNRDKALRALHRTIVPLFALERNLLEREESLKKLSRIFDISYDTLASEVNGLLTRPDYREEITPTPSQDREDVPTRLFIDLNALLDFVSESADPLMVEEIKAVRDLLKPLVRNPDLIRQQQIAERLFAFEEYFGSEERKKALGQFVQELITRADLEHVVDERKRIVAELRDVPSEGKKKNELLERVRDLDRSRQMLLDKLSTLL